MNTDLAMDLLRLALAVLCATMTLSSTFSLVLGYRHHHKTTRTRDLRLAAADVVVFAGITVALLAVELPWGLVLASPFTATLGYLLFIAESPQAERRIADSTRHDRRATASRGYGRAGGA